MLKKLVITIVVILGLLSVYFGAYKPLAKSQMYIDAQSHIPTYRTMGELKTNFDRVFEFNSPIGQREVVKFASSQFENAILNKNQSEVASLSIVQYIEDKIFEDNVVHLLQIGNMYEILYDRFERNEYADLSEEYYREVKKIGPKLPHPLYNLFNLYKKTGETEKMEKAGERILELWPEDKQIKKALNKLSQSSQ